MEPVIDNLVQQFERGGLSRRQLIQGLSLLVASSAGAAAAQPVGLHGRNVGHVSVLVADLPRSIDFYSKTFGFTVNSQDQANRIVRLGQKTTVVSLRQGQPAGLVDHYAINVEGFNKAQVTEVLKQRGLTPQENLEFGFHVKDPDGVNVQIT